MEKLNGPKKNNLQIMMFWGYPMKKLAFHPIMTGKTHPLAHPFLPTTAELLISFPTKGYRKEVESTLAKLTEFEEVGYSSGTGGMVPS